GSSVQWFGVEQDAVEIEDGSQRTASERHRSTVDHASREVIRRSDGGRLIGGVSVELARPTRGSGSAVGLGCGSGFGAASAAETLARVSSEAVKGSSSAVGSAVGSAEVSARARLLPSEK